MVTELSQEQKDLGYVHTGFVAIKSTVRMQTKKNFLTLKAYDRDRKRVFGAQWDISLATIPPIGSRSTSILGPETNMLDFPKEFYPPLSAPMMDAVLIRVKTVRFSKSIKFSSDQGIRPLPQETNHAKRLTGQTAILVPTQDTEPLGGGPVSRNHSSAVRRRSRPMARCHHPL